MDKKRKLNKLIVAIDGPVGSGKSTAAKRVAKQLYCPYADSGALYRAVTWLVIEGKLNASDKQTIEEATKQAKIELVNTVDNELSPSNSLQVFVNGADITKEIRSQSVTQLVSMISEIPGVRNSINARLQEMAECDGVVMDGRDIGTVVFPQADLKIFLTASIEVRAKRRWEELEAADEKIELDKLKKEIEKRDYDDTNRSVAPLCQAPDAIVIDTDNLTVDEVVTQIVELANNLPPKE